MRRARCRWRLNAGMTIAVTSLIAMPVATPMPHVQVRDVRLTSGDGADSPLGDGTAFVIGGSGIPIPPERYVDAANTLYLQPREFTGTPQALDTPEGFYPTTGVNSSTADASEAQGAQILDGAITGQIAEGNVDAANPVVVFGYSQSSAMSTFTMQQLQAQGVPSDDVHFVLVGDTAAPNGGLLERFDLPGADLSVPSFGITFGNPTPADLYPTDIYTLEYDGFADFPQYPIDPLSDLNAFAGMIYEHLTYLDLTPAQIANAIPLATLQSAGDSLTDYYMIPVGDLPLLDPLRLIPFVGNPLADLLQPDMTVLVNLGYGSITDGWSQGPANVSTPVRAVPDRPQLVRCVNRAGQRGGARRRRRHRRSGKSGQLSNPVTAGQPDVGAAGGCGVHVRARRHPAADVRATDPSAARRQFPAFRRDPAFATD
jgi:PE-PPE domain